MRPFDKLRVRLEDFSGVPTSPCVGIKIHLFELQSAAKERVWIFRGKASVGLKKIHSAIFCYFPCPDISQFLPDILCFFKSSGFLKKVEG